MIVKELSSFPSGLYTRTGYLEEGNDISDGGLGGDESRDSSNSTDTFLAGSLTDQLVDLQYNNFKSIQSIQRDPASKDFS